MILQNHHSSESMSSNDVAIDEMARKVLRPDTQAVIANNAEKIYDFWKTLHTRSLIPNNPPDLDMYVMKAFQFLDTTMANQELPHQLCRLSHVALTKMVDSLKKVVAANRRQGKVQSRSGYRNAAIVMDIYLHAQGILADRVRAKRQLNRRMETSRRWTQLTRGCPLLLATLADAAESLVFNRKISNATLGAVGARLLVLVGPTLIAALNQLQALAEVDVQANTAEAQAILGHVISVKAILASGI